MSDDRSPAIDFFEGTVLRITFQNPQNGFTILKAEPLSKRGEETTVVGAISSGIRTGATFIARGVWQTHQKFGRQFKAYSVTEKEPTGREAVLRYLSSGAVKGLGPKLAERIVDRFGDDTLRILDEDPELLAEVPGIGSKKLEEIVSMWSSTKTDREVLLFLEGLGLGAGLSLRIKQRYGARAIEVVSADPYFLIEDLWGVGFIRADEIAKKLGIAPESSQRIRAGLLHELKRGSEDGHLYLPREQLLRRARTLLGVDDTEKIEEALKQVIFEALVIAEEDRISLPSLAQAERSTARSIVRLLSTDPSHPIDLDLAEKLSGEAIALTDGGETRVIRLSEQQRDAIRLAATSGLMVLTGGPGCGKTTVVKTIARLIRESGLRLRLAAPTGRAAQRLSDVCGVEASTIHRLLRYDPSTRGFIHTAEEPLELDALILDESSMIDIPLAAALLEAIPAGARVIVVGDADQLPSVGPGLFLGDLLELDSIARVRLTNLFRRSESSSISAVAHQINLGELPDIPEPDGITKSDSYFLPARDPVQGAELIEKLVVDQIPKRFGFKGAEIAVLTPMNQGELGVIQLNQRLQTRLVPKIPGTPGVLVGNTELRLGDRVCQRVNNYLITEGGVFNGEQGEIVGIDAEDQSVFVRFWDGREVRYTSDVLYQLDLAYALSIHRSQGSEMPVVVLAIHDAHTILLERQLLYTAVTRAKKLLIIVGSKRALVLAVKKTRSRSRNTALVGLVRRFLEQRG